MSIFYLEWIHKRPSVCEFRETIPEEYNFTCTVNLRQYKEILPTVTLYGNINPWLSNEISYIGTLETENLEMPSDFRLNSIYPNPFNPTTTIDFSVPYSTHLSLKVIDLQGRVVETIVNQEYNTGNYSVEYNASLLSSGIYFIQLKSSSFVEYSKIILLK